MLPTIPLTLLAGLLVGLVFAWAARGPFHDGRNPWGDEVRAVASYELVIRWPLLVYYFLAHREWSLMYLVRADHLPGWLLVLLLPLDAAALLGGYLAGWSLLRRRARSQLQLVIGGVALAVFLLALFTRDRLVRDCETATFGVDGHPPVDAKLVAASLVILCGSALAAVFVYRVLAAASTRRKSSGARPGATQGA